MAEVMLPTLETERLILRAFQPDDAPNYTAMLNDPVIAHMTDGVPIPYPQERAEKFIAEAAEWNKAGTHCIFAPCQKSDGRLIGEIGLWHIHPEHLCGDLGIIIGSEFRGQGFSTEALRCIIDHGFSFHNLNRIDGSCFSDNEASERMMLRCGFVYEGMKRKRWSHFGEFRDDKLFGLLRSEWEAGNQYHASSKTASSSTSGDS